MNRCLDIILNKNNEHTYIHDIYNNFCNCSYSITVSPNETLTFNNTY